MDSDEDKSSSFLDGLTILIPSVVRTSLIDLPIPLEAPVTNAVFDSISLFIHS